MRHFTSQDLQKRTGEVQEAALLEPIAITHHGRKRHVMMSVAEYERLKKSAEPRVYRMEEIPADMLADLGDARMDPRHERLNDLIKD